MRRAYMLVLALAVSVLSAFAGAPEIAPVASYFHFRFAHEPHAKELDLWVIRPQVWTDGIPSGVEIMTSKGAYSLEPKAPAPFELTATQQKALFHDNKALALYLLRSVHAFRLKQVLRDFKVASEAELPPRIREELASIKSGERAFAVLLKPSGLGADDIELTVGVSYEILSENRLAGRGVLENGEVFKGLTRSEARLESFTDNEFLELGGTQVWRSEKKREYAAGARAELTTFAKSENSPFDLVPTIHQLLITMGMTRFGLTPVETAEIPLEWPRLLSDPRFRDSIAYTARLEERENERKKGRAAYSLAAYRVSSFLARRRRISTLSIEAIGGPDGKNKLSRMYRDWMGFHLTHHFPRDPDFPAWSTDILEMSAEDFELRLAEKLGKRSGAEILRTGALHPKFIYFGEAFPGQELPPIFFLQPAHDRYAARRWIEELMKDPAAAGAIEKADKEDLDDPRCSRLLAGIKRLPYP